MVKRELEPVDKFEVSEVGAPSSNATIHEIVAFISLMKRSHTFVLVTISMAI